MKMKNIVGTICLLFLATAFSSNGDRKKKTELFNGKDLSGWDTYLGPAYDSTLKKFSGTSEGLNKDSRRVFSVAQIDGKAAIRISGERFGGISTKEAFENYHLRLEFKWGKHQWLPKKRDPRDSGLLYHAVGPHGADGNFWMRSQEFQIQENDCGDYWGVAGGTADIPAVKKNDTHYVYEPAGSLLTFSATSVIGRRCIKNPDAEKPSGEWNVIDLYCMGDTSVHVVNNVVNMVLYNLRQEDKGKFSPLMKGKIQIQSEGAEVFYRNITVENIDRIPSDVVK
jgi:hypothetical protein